MEFKEALILAENSKDIIGKKYKNDVIEEIIIAPTGKDVSNQFWHSYRNTLNAQKAILPFVNRTDLDVFVIVRKDLLVRENILIATSITAIK